MKLRKNEILRHFRDMIRLKTISSVDSEETEEAFAGFRLREASVFDHPLLP